MMSKKFFLIGGLTGLMIATAGIHQGAYAGFQFTAPVGQVQETQPIPPIANGLLPSIPDIQIENQPPATMAAQPVAPVDAAPTPLAVPSASMPSAPMPTPAMPTRAPQTGLTSLAPQQAQPVPAMPISAPMPAPIQGGYDVAVGFGRDLPLVTALRQVVPANYTYVMDDSVPMGQNVSWEGGRPWNLVLQDMISPLGLTAQIRGNQVAIISYNAGSTPSQAAANIPVAPVMPEMNAVEDTLPPLPMATPVAYNAPPMPQSVTTASMVVPQVSRGSWIANRGDSLRGVLEEWVGQAGAELFWSSDYDYPLAGAVNISGSFEEAVETLLKGFEQARPKPIARLHPNLPHGPAVLVVETRQTLD